jgi:hypothetical protein
MGNLNNPNDNNFFFFSMINFFVFVFKLLFELDIDILAF